MVERLTRLGGFGVEVKWRKRIWILSRASRDKWPTDD